MPYHDFDPEFPHWVHEAVRNGGGCPHCKGPLDESLITGIGVSVDGTSVVQTNGYRGRVYIRCPQCKSNIAFDMNVMPAEIVGAVSVMIDLCVHGDPALQIEDDDEEEDDDDVTLPSPNYPPSEGGPLDDHYQGVPFGDDRSPTEKRLDAMKRRRKRQLQRPPDEQEVEVFKNKLKRISFKRDTKSWRDFLVKLGIDPDTGEVNEQEGGQRDA